MDAVTTQILISTSGIVLSGVAAPLLVEKYRIKSLKLSQKAEHDAWIRTQKHAEKNAKNEAYRQLLVDIDDLDVILSTGFMLNPVYVDLQTVEAAERKVKAQIASVLMLVDDDALESSIRAVSERLSNTRFLTVEAMSLSEDAPPLLPQLHKSELRKLTKEILQAFRRDLA